MSFRYTLTSGRDAPFGDGWQEVDPHDRGFEFALRDALADPELASVVAELDEALEPGTVASERLATALRFGRLRLFRIAERRPNIVPGTPGGPGDPLGEPTPLTDLLPADASEPESEEPPPPPRPTWIEITIVDADEQPIKNRPFRLRLADGSVREGTTGENGEIRFDDVNAGLCVLALPTQSEDEWDPAKAG